MTGMLACPPRNRVLTVAPDLPPIHRMVSRLAKIKLHLALAFVRWAKSNLLNTDDQGFWTAFCPRDILRPAVNDQIWPKTTQNDLWPHFRFQINSIISEERQISPMITLDQRLWYAAFCRTCFQPQQIGPTAWLQRFTLRKGSVHRTSCTAQKLKQKANTK